MVGRRRLLCTVWVALALAGCQSDAPNADAPAGDAAGGAGPCAADACRAEFINDQWRLRLEVLDDDLLHFGFGRAGEPPRGAWIPVTVMVARTDYPGPTSLERPGDTELLTPEMAVSVAADTLCVTVTDRLRDFTAAGVCPHAPGDLRLETPGATHAYGLGQAFVPAPQFGDLVGKVRSPGNEFGNAMTGFGGGATGNTQIPFLLALGEGNDAWGLFVDVVEAQTWALRGEAWRVNSTADTVGGFVMTGPDAVDVRADYLELTGRPPVPPRRLFGLWISEYGYDDWDEATDKLRTLDENRFPMDGFVLDLQWFGGIRDPSQMGTLTWDTESFPDPVATLAGLEERFGVKAIHIEESYIDEALPVHADLAERGYLVRECDGCQPVFMPSWWGNGGMLDWSNAEAGAWWHDNRRRPLIEDGLFAHWTDLGEPENFDEVGWYAGGPSGARNTQAAVHNLYNFFWAQSIYDGYARDGKDRRPAMLTRSGTAGVQRFGAIMWSGDIGTNAASLDSHFNTQTHVTASGIDYYGSDIGGFHRGGMEGEALDVLYTQWLASSALLDVPVRPHVMNLSNAFETAPDRIGDPASNRANLQLRYALTPYLYSLAHRAWRSGEPVFPPLVLRYAADAATRSLWSHKLVGDDLLAVVEADTEVPTRRVYLPAGRWANFHTGEWLESSGQWFDDQPTVIDGVTRVPLYARAGAIVPLMHVDDQTVNLDGRRRDGTRRDELVVRVYAGDTPSEFVLLEDDGRTVAYQRGEVRETTLAQRTSADAVTFTVGAAEGTFDGAVGSRSVVVDMHSHAGAVGSVSLDGQPLTRHDTSEALQSAGSGWWSPDGQRAWVVTPERPVTESRVLTFAID